MLTISTILLVLGFAGHGLGHFILQDPKAIGTKDSDQAIEPCGGYDPTSRVNEVDWPVGGRALYVISTHLVSLWSFKAALLNNTDDWIDLGPQVYQNGFGHMCLPNIPGVEAWVGQEGVVQIIQDASHGILYQCIATTFVDGDATGPIDSCKNSTDIEAVFTSSVAPEDAPTASLLHEVPNTTATGGADSDTDEEPTAGIGFASLLKSAFLVTGLAVIPAAVMFMT